jgi:hypothetical protein
VLKNQYMTVIGMAIPSIAVNQPASPEAVSQKAATKRSVSNIVGGYAFCEVSNVF